MRASTAILVFLLATTATAQDPQDAQVRDYSKDTLLRLFIDAAEQESEHPISYGGGAVAFDALGTSWRFNYYPMMPFSGTLGGITQEVPDPLALTNTVLATPKRAWRTRREINAERKRIDATERAKVKVTVGTGSN
jgi:hypothetical protein